MRILNVKFMSNFDVLANLFKTISAHKTARLVSEPDTVTINNTVKTLKKGRSICDKLSQ